MTFGTIYSFVNILVKLFLCDTIKCQTNPEFAQVYDSFGVFT